MSEVMMTTFSPGLKEEMAALHASSAVVMIASGDAAGSGTTDWMMPVRRSGGRSSENDVEPYFRSILPRSEQTHKEKAQRTACDGQLFFTPRSVFMVTRKLNPGISTIILITFGLGAG